MALIIKDRVKEFSVTVGTGDFTLGGTSGPFQPFSSVCLVSDTFWYAIAEQSGVQWEVGQGTYISANTIRRDTVYASSNANTVVIFDAGTKDVFITPPATVISKILDIGDLQTLLTSTKVSAVSAINELQGEIDTLTSTVAGAVRYDIVQTLNTSEKLQANTNTGIGDPEIDLAATYAASKI